MYSEENKLKTFGEKTDVDLDKHFEDHLRDAFQSAEDNGLKEDSTWEFRKLQELNQIVANQPDWARGPRLAFFLGRFVCLVPVDPKVSVGRKGHDLDLAIPSRSLSRRHFELAMDGRSCVVRDLGSKNSTKVNGRVIESKTLVAGDMIEAGGISFFYLDDDPEDPDFVELDHVTSGGG